MSLEIDFNDPGAWDDNELVDSWNQAFEEYRKFHSIHASGKTLSEALTKEEIADLENRGISLVRKRPRGDSDAQDGADGEEDVEGEDLVDEDDQDDEDRDQEYTGVNGNQIGHDTHTNVNNLGGSTTNTADIPSDAQIPQHLLNSVPDESLKNLMMSWYWAGYYTGYHQGKIAAQPETT